MSQTVISFHYTLTDSAGKELDSSAGSDPLTFLTGVGQIIAGLEKQLHGMKPGDKRRIEVQSAEAYGPHDPKNVTEMPLAKMPTQKIKVGDRFRAGDGQHAPVVTVTKITGSQVTLDGNHPLAGLDLTFDVEITAVRPATDEESAHGHAHGAGGHHHH